MSQTNSEPMMDHIYNLIFEDPDARRENANVNADTQNGALFLLGTEAGKALALQKLLPADMADAHTSGDIHIHDLPFYGLSFNCIQHDLCKLFSRAFKIDTCSIRQPQSVESMGALLAIVLQTAQGESFGGQGVPDYDFVMAEGVRKTFRREFELELNRLPLASDIQELRNKAWDAAWRNTERRTFQAAEALVHNLNSLRARAGGQLTFSNLNYGLDTSAEGRMATHCLLKTTMEGLGDRATPIFPVQMFLVKEGVNYNPGDPNYDLFQLAMECSAKRMWPNFIFLDAPFNKDKEVRMFGCRTRVVNNAFDPTKEVAAGRGNLFFTTINLPRLGLKATGGGGALGHGDIPLFFDLLDNVIDLGIRQLHHRFNILAHKKVRNFPFLFGEGIWLGSETLDPDDEIGDVWKHGTLSLGFIGLAETLTALIGKHHGESDEAQKLGLEIVGHMRKRLDFESRRKQMNFTLLATPAEGLCLAGDTLVQTPNGSRPIKDIRAGDLVFSRNEEGFIEVDKVVRAWQTFPSRKVVRVTFDTGQEIVCTPNHPFGVRYLLSSLSRDGKWQGGAHRECVVWINACDLKEGMRVSSNYFQKTSAGRLKVKCHSQAKEIFVHRLVYTYYHGDIPDGFVVHHKNGDLMDNRIENLELMRRQDHKRLHLKDNIARYCYKSEDMYGDKNHFYGKRHSEESKQKIRDSIKQRYPEGRPAWNYIPYEPFVSDFLNGFSIYDLQKKYSRSRRFVMKKLQEGGINPLEQNHIVKRVEWLDKEIPVYDITVKKNSNFFVGDDRGILVHNSGRFVKLDQARYGEIPGVTDKEYYTNSFHIPVDFTISAFDKIALEAPYHALTNAGHITYVELDGDPSKNLEAFETIVRAMHDAGIGYGAINHPLDFDPVCGFSGVIDNECPGCGRKADEKVQRVRRLTGYLAPVNRWNAGKLAELKDRRPHCLRQASQGKTKKHLREG